MPMTKYSSKHVNITISKKMNGSIMNYAIPPAKSNFNCTEKDHRRAPVFLITIPFSSSADMKKTKVRSM